MSRVLPNFLNACVLSSVMICSAASAQTASFAGFAGAWSGSGSISLADGSQERLRCRAMHRTGGADHQLHLSVRCASDSYKFELGSDVVNRNGAISGTWNEASRGLRGEISGKLSVGTIAASVETPGFSARLSVVTRGDRQSVIIQSRGEVRKVSISLQRS